MSSNNDKNEQLLNDIQTLQNIEEKLFISLDSDPILTTEQQEKIIGKINSISQMRMNLYKTLGGVNQFFQDALTNTESVLNQQKMAIKLVEDNLNNSKKKLQDLELQKNNKIRLIEINDYYGEKYDEHTTLMKYVIYTLIPIIIISILFNIGILPSFLFYLLLVIVTTIGSVFIIYRMMSIWNRDNMYYQNFDWGFNSKNAPTSDSENSSNPWSLPDMNMGACIGDLCCSPGTVYDNTINKCVIPGITQTQHTSQDITQLTSQTQPTTETFMNNIFTKFSNIYKKPNVVLNNNVLPSNF